MRTGSAVAALSFTCALLWPAGVRAQLRGSPDWMTAGGDAQRSSWIRTAPKISVERLRLPGFALAWKIRLNHEPGPAVTLSRYIGYRGFRSLAFVSDAAGQLTAIDTDLARIEWTKTIAAATIQGGASTDCSGGAAAELARATTPAFPPSPAGRGGAVPGRSGPAKSAVGGPDEGAVTIAQIAAREAMVAAAGRGAPARGPVGLRRMPSFLDVLSRDGAVHRMYVSNGDEPSPPIPFLPSGAYARGFIILGNTAYAATSHGCGGVSNGIWALDLTSKQTAHWEASGDVAGDTGAAFGPDSTVYAATTGGELVALDPQTLQLKMTYRSGGQAFLTSPLVFDQNSKTMIAAAAKDNRLHLLDAQSFTGSAVAANISGALTSWEDRGGTRWIAAPTRDSITAWKVAAQGGIPVLQPGWTSRELAAPKGPVMVNGVLFTVSNSSTPVLYAFDADSGKELWNSGRTIAAPIRDGGLTGSETEIYLGTSDGTIYAFGFPIEH
jgi:outer membrane protein assembly factor BamB